MLISICIPHYNRSRYLLSVLDSIVSQSHSLIEVVISDDCSTDDSAELISSYIADKQSETHVKFRYIRHSKNRGYDGNTRAALAAASGEYLLLLGNDDALSDETAIERLAKTLQALDFPDVAFTNYCSYLNRDAVTRRAFITANLGSGPAIAVRVFRSFSFVGGIVYRRQAFQSHNTDAYDGSIYVQVYLASRIIASGGSVASIDDVIVAKDVVVNGKEAVNFCERVAQGNDKIAAHTGGLDQFARVACDAILPFVPAKRRGHVMWDIYRQIYLYTYPYWLFRYRRDGVFRASINLALGCYPQRLIRVKKVPRSVYWRLLGYYLEATLAGLCTPLGMLDALMPRLYRLAKSV